MEAKLQFFIIKYTWDKQKELSIPFQTPDHNSGTVGIYTL